MPRRWASEVWVTPTATSLLTWVRGRALRYENVRGIKTNTNYTCKLLSELDVCAISEHWLHNYDLHQLQSLHKDFNAFSTCSLTEEDPITCTPRFIRGSGGVSILWRKSLDGVVRKLPDVSNDRVVAIQVLMTNRPVRFLSVYLPSRSSCTITLRTAWIMWMLS